MSFNLGINILEVDGRVAPSIQPAPTSVAGFIIRAQRGLAREVVQVTNWSEFVEHFGSYVDVAYGAYAVRGFFDNGGGTAFVTRVINTEPGRTRASIVSSVGPWALEPGKKLIFLTDGAPTRPVEVPFNASGAMLAGNAGRFDLQESAGNGKKITLKINGITRGPYQFVAGDFPDGLDKATAAQVAAVLNREFPGIQAWVADQDKLCVRTDRKGSSASLQMAQVKDNDFGAAVVLGFNTGSEQRGSGDVADIDEVTPAEAVARIRAVLEPIKLRVAEDGGKIAITHPDMGKDHWIQVDAQSAPLDKAFGFDNQKHSGTDGDAAAAAMASSHAFGTALTVKAGYRGSEDPGFWGDRLKVSIVANSEDANLFDLVVSYDDKVVETWTSLSIDQSAKRYVKSVINNEFSGSKFILVDPTGDTKPANAEPTALSGGNDGAFASPDAELNAYAASIDLFDLIDIQLLCCPEHYEEVVVEKALTHCENKGDRMFAGHTPFDYDAGAAKGFGKNFQGSKVYGALYFPWIRVADPIGTQKWIPPTGHVLGVYARTERERGIWKAPAGNAARLSGVLDVEKNITDLDHTDLVKNGGVNAVRYIPGQGIVVDSSRTLSSSPLWLYVNVRLLFNFVKSSLKSGLRWVVQEPNDPTLWNKVKHNSVTPFLMSLWRRGAFGPGAPQEVFTVKVDAENNPPENIQQGLLTVEVYFYPSRPAETIIIVVGQQEGGATAAEK